MMSSQIIITDKPKEWIDVIPGVGVTTPGEYFSGDHYLKSRKFKVVNLCKSYNYQSLGYYVSLLAEARGHKVMPEISTLQDFRFPSLVKEDAEDFDDLIQSALKKQTSERLDLYICFGKVHISALNKIGTLLFNLFQVPILKAVFQKKEKWTLTNLKPLNLIDFPEELTDHLKSSLDDYFQGKNRLNRQYTRKKYDMAILINPDEQTPPSSKKAIQNFIKAGEKVGFNVDLITKNDFAKLIQYDALFIRETTNVNHHTFKFSKKAAAEGLIVMDDPNSILRCTNKVYLSELLQSHQIPTPKYWIFKKDKNPIKTDGLEFPIILKQPDGSFSKGVKKARDEKEFQEVLKDFFQTSELVIAQEFIPTDFDWRVGVLNKKAIFVCKYFMAANHWQIMNWQTTGSSPDQGLAETIPIEEAPKGLLELAIKATSLVGNGLYGVDIKQTGKKFCIIEINDNPNIDDGVEDKVTKQQLYVDIMQEFMNRLI